MVHGYEYGAKYIIKLNKEINWFELIPDIMKETKTYLPYPKNKNPLINTIDITDFLCYNFSLKCADEEVNDLFNTYMSLENVCFSDYYENATTFDIEKAQEELNIKRTEVREKIQIKLNNSSEIVPFTLTDSELIIIQTIKDYCDKQNIEILYKGWFFIREFY